MTVSDLLAVAVLGFVGLRLAEAAHASTRRGSRSWELVLGLRPRHFGWALPIVAAVLAVAVALSFVPGLSVGWWSLLGGVGNPVLGSTSATAGSPLELLVPAVFLGLLLLGLPLLVHREEWIFRRGAEARTFSANARWALLFGLAHAVVGIPLAAALALSLGGAYLTWAYRRGWRASGTRDGALLESSRAHLAYNLVIVGLIAVSLGVELLLAG